MALTLYYLILVALIDDAAPANRDSHWWVAASKNRLRRTFPYTAHAARIARYDTGASRTIPRELFRLDVDPHVASIGTVDAEHLGFNVTKSGQPVFRAAAEDDDEDFRTLPKMKNGDSVYRNMVEKYWDFVNDGKNFTVKWPSMPIKATPLIDQKFFFESKVNPHQDKRFFNGSFYSNVTLRHNALVGLIDSWGRFGEETGTVSWIAHGVLIGWFWNQNLLPWDQDIDYQTSLYHLLALQPYNNTLIHSRYLLELNPNLLYRQHQRMNVIDARYIDTLSGLYIDITALVDLEDTTSSGDRVACKSVHRYNYEDLFPLKQTVLEGRKVWRPNRVMMLLAN
ncbi:hypothetical protein HK101_004408, partial [Irineochytrium annulatum]